MKIKKTINKKKDSNNKKDLKSNMARLSQKWLKVNVPSFDIKKYGGISISK